jgi:hypothetical protein
MKRVERLAWVTVAGVLCNVMAWVSIEGCSGDNNSDAGDGGDAALDQTTPDVGNDVSPDVATDVTPDVVKDAGPDVTAIVAFQQAYAAALCQRMSVCCYGAQLDASAPDAAIGTCEAFTTSAFGGGFENAIGDLATTSVLNSGNIVVNEPQRTNCLAALQTMSCPTISGTEYASLAQNCVGALSGTLPVGQPCGRSVECNNGYCLRDDAGVGTCVAIATVGQACNPEGNGNDECMYRSWVGSTTARCDVTDTEAGTCNTFGTPSFKCTAKTANGGGCFYEWECASDTCSDSCTCTAATQAWTLVGTGVCPSYFGADSGLN